jgi:hypothetical protein
MQNLDWLKSVRPRPPETGRIIIGALSSADALPSGVATGVVDLTAKEVFEEFIVVFEMFRGQMPMDRNQLFMGIEEFGQLQFATDVAPKKLVFCPCRGQGMHAVAPTAS